MLKLKNAAGEELMTLHEDGREEFKDKKLQEQFEKGKGKKEDEGEK